MKHRLGLFWMNRDLATDAVLLLPMGQLLSMCTVLWGKCLCELGTRCPRSSGSDFGNLWYSTLSPKVHSAHVKIIWDSLRKSEGVHRSPWSRLTWLRTYSLECCSSLTRVHVLGLESWMRWTRCVCVWRIYLLWVCWLVSFLRSATVHWVRPFHVLVKQVRANQMDTCWTGSLMFALR